MGSDRAMTLRKSDWLDDWYVIEWAEHEHTMGVVPVGGRGFAFTHSGRVGDADVEGTAAEMLALAAAIESGGWAGGSRCRAVTRPDGKVHLCSPRNSIDGIVVTRESAASLAAEIRRVLVIVPSMGDAEAQRCD